MLLVTADGIPVAFELVPANTDERDAAEEVLPSANPNSIALGDSQGIPPRPQEGFIDEERQVEWQNCYGVSVQTFKRKNQYVKNEPEVIENTGAKTVLGLSTRVIVKITSYTFRHYLLRFYGINVLDFQVVTIS